LLTEDIKAFEKNRGQAGKEETRSWLTATRQSMLTGWADCERGELSG